MLSFTTLLTTLLALSVNTLAAPAADANAAPEPDTLIARHGQYLGGVDLDPACRDQWFRFAYLVQSGNGCNAWTCSEFIEFGVSGLSIDMNQVCTKTYGGSVYAWCENGAYDWKCYRTP